MGMENGADPRAVLERLSKLEVGVGRASPREPTTPSMESPTNLDHSMREWLNNRLGNGSTSNATNARLYTKLLVSNAAAGSIIGKAGGSINDFQTRTYARIQLSKAAEYYPGTAERTLLVTGRLKQVVAALSLIFDKLQREGVAPLSPRTRANLETRGPQPSYSDSSNTHRLMVKVLVPQLLCGIIIGKGGTTVRAFSADTQTTIRVTSPEGPALALNHRIVTVNGSPDNVLRAIALLTLKQSEDPKYSMFSELPSNYLTPMAMGGPHGVSPLAIGPYGINPAAAMAMQQQMHHYQYGGGVYGAATPPFTTTGTDGNTTVSYPITEEQAVVLEGQTGSGLEELQAASGVHILLEQQEGPDHVLTSRLVVTGHPEAVSYTHFLMGQRLMGAMVQQQYPPMYQQYPTTGHGTAGYYQQSAAPYRQQYGNGQGMHYMAVDGGRRPSPRTLTPRQNEEM